MSKLLKRILSLALVVVLVGSVFVGCKQEESTPEPVEDTPATSEPAEKEESSKEEEKDAGKPIKISLFYSDNATLPYREDWLAITAIKELVGAELEFEPIPIADYQTKVSLALNTGTNAPDVILYQSTTGENVSLATNGAIVPISDYSEHTPHFNARVEEFGLEEEMAERALSDGKRYYLPALYDKQFYDGGLIMREDLLEEYGLDVPTTFDEFYDVLKVFKENNPDSYPLTILAGPRVLYRMTMPSFGVSLGQNAASGTNVLSWDYDKKEYFPGAIDDRYKEYIRYFNKLYEEGLLDPEMADPIDGDAWAQKLATGKSMATYAYYDQIGGVEGSSEIDGFKLNMFPPLEGTAGAHHQPKSRTSSGILFPSGTADRDDFTDIVEIIDEAFFSEEAGKIWALGVEGTTYNTVGDSYEFVDEIQNAADGPYKFMQVEYGCGTAVTQMIWEIELEMLKYDDNYAEINAKVAEMPDAIQPVPPTPLFDDLTAEDANTLQSPLADAFEVWIDDFLTGRKSIDNDWDAYVAEMESLQIEEFNQLYNDHLR